MAEDAGRVPRLHCVVRTLGKTSLDVRAASLPPWGPTSLATPFPSPTLPVPNFLFVCICKISTERKTRGERASLRESQIDSGTGFVRLLIVKEPVGTETPSKKLTRLQDHR